MLIAPLPASITTGVPHAVRTLNFLPTWQILSAVGLVAAIQLLLNLKHKTYNLKIIYIIGILYFMFSVLNFAYYLNQYFVQQNYYYSQDWQYGYKQAVEEAKLLENKYQKIIVSNRLSMDQSYMFFLFYWKYPPAVYQNYKVGSSGFDKTHVVGKYEFRAIDWSRDPLNKETLYITSPEIIPEGANVIKKINNLDGSQTIIILD
jgi:hypothetical protein